MLLIERRHANEVIAHAIQEDPNECCGILAGKDGVVSHLYRITNTLKSPTRYLMNPQEQLEAMLDSERHGWELLAFYHSHTQSPAYPSRTDIRMAVESGWLDVYYVLVTLENSSQSPIRAFRIKGTGEVREEDLEVE